MLGFASTFAFAVILEKLGKVFQRLSFPFMNLIRMDAILGGNLSHALVFSDCFQDDLCFLNSG